MPKSTASAWCWTCSRPPAQSNGLGIVDVASGAFYSDRGKIEDHRRAQMYDIFCGKGYTVFAVRPGSITKFSLAEMAKNLKQGVALGEGTRRRIQDRSRSAGHLRRVGRRPPGFAARP